MDLVAAKSLWQIFQWLDGKLVTVSGDLFLLVCASTCSLLLCSHEVNLVVDSEG